MKQHNPQQPYKTMIMKLTHRDVSVVNQKDHVFLRDGMDSLLLPTFARLHFHEKEMPSVLLKVTLDFTTSYIQV